jgi:hypothetical protein
VSTTPAKKEKNFEIKFVKTLISGIVYTGEQFFGGVDKFLAFWLFLTGINDTGEKC